MIKANAWIVLNDFNPRHHRANEHAKIQHKMNPESSMLRIGCV